ncbi:hypothetical protein [Hydrogenophaga sp. 5NK40-0174]|uniref:ubiquinone biosynthesis accessory factor UbiJ n=1 Tax=Hydrogenophaga sp. 5NK40-0174 TaxID=3127649 RepID=UPI0031096CB1
MMSISGSGASGLLSSLKSALKPPQWVVSEMQNRIVLFLNHVLQQEPQAMERLRRQAGKRVRASWGDIFLTLSPTAAGLLELAHEGERNDLAVVLTEQNPFSMARTLAEGDRPAVDIQGDVQLAAEVAWLVDNVRWDVEEDLSRIMGDGPAHKMASVGRQIVHGLRSFLAKTPSVASTGRPSSGNPGSQG